jgi:MinD-like ATPase involved in chromosome partitioning or flagellar assembly
MAPAARTHVSREPQTTARPELNLKKLIPTRDKGGVSEKLLEQVRFPLHDATVGIFSRKGGVGKTTITAYLGLTLATLRHRPIIALDGDSEAGSLGWLLAPNAPSTLDALAGAQPMPTSRQEFARYVAHTKSGLDVVLGDTGEQTPVSEKGLRHAVHNLSKSYDMSLFDTGSGVTHGTGRTLINNSRVLLLVMGTSVDSVRAAERTLAWLDEREDAGTPPTTVIAVINGIPSNMRLSQIQQIEHLFTDRCAAVVRIPFDEHLAGGTTSADLALLTKPTQQEFQQLAATTVRVLARSMPLQVNGNRQHA